MKPEDATEQAYKNGYEDGYRDGKDRAMKDIAFRKLLARPPEPSKEELEAILYNPPVFYVDKEALVEICCDRWIPVTERLPKNFISVLGYMTDAGDFPPVRECYTVGNAFFFPALGDVHPVSHWMPLPEPPEG